jgi:hypothetical protein
MLFVVNSQCFPRYLYLISTSVLCFLVNKYTISTAVSGLLSIGYCSLRVGVSWPWLGVKESLLVLSFIQFSSFMKGEHWSLGSFAASIWIETHFCQLVSQITSLILTSMYTCHMDSRWYALDSHVVILTYLVVACLLTPWSRVRPEKLIGSQLVNKFLAFYGTRNFISSFTSPRHLSLAWAGWIQSLSPRHDASPGTGWRIGFLYGGLMQIYSRSSRRQPTRGVLQLGGWARFW